MDILGLLFVSQIVLIFIVIIGSVLLEKVSINNEDIVFHHASTDYQIIAVIMIFIMAFPIFIQSHSVFVMEITTCVNVIITIGSFFLKHRMITIESKVQDKQCALMLLEELNIESASFKQLSRAKQIALLESSTYVYGVLEGEKVFDFDAYNEDYTYEDDLKDFEPILNKE